VHQDKGQVVRDTISFENAMVFPRIFATLNWNGQIMSAKVT
jgi:hypothetical protein